jgi:hypothetical protein
VLNIVDAIIAGHGNGPLSPQPARLGLLFGGENSAAVDHVAARLLRYDPERIPITRQAFDQFSYPIAPGPAREVSVAGDLGIGEPAPILDAFLRDAPPLSYPIGWLDAVADRWRAGALAAGTAQAPHTAPTA